MRPENFFIKDGYKHRTEFVHFDDTPFKDEFQDSVYLIAKKHDDSCVVDVGCGSGFKLMKHFPDAFTIGIDVPQTIAFCKQAYPGRSWLTTEEPVLSGHDLVICSDVIEHVEDPYRLLDFLVSLSPKVLVISTPERDLLRLGTQDGPPRNIHHMREWNKQEFLLLISSRFKVVGHSIVDGSTQVVEAICKSQQ